MQNFRTYQLAKDLFHKSKGVKLKTPYRNQFERAMLSIADRRRFYEIALGSLREAQALIDILELDHLAKDADVLGAHIFRLCSSLGLGGCPR